jgi:hypothetical protein
MESKGWELETKYEDPLWAYEGASVYISSNRLPAVATKYEVGTEDYEDLWEPFTERCHIVRLEYKFKPGIEKPMYDHTHICHLWLKWHDKYADCVNVPYDLIIPEFKQPEA